MTFWVHGNTAMWNADAVEEKGIYLGRLAGSFLYHPRRTTADNCLQLGLMYSFAWPLPGTDDPSLWWTPTTLVVRLQTRPPAGAYHPTLSRFDVRSHEKQVWDSLYREASDGTYLDPYDGRSSPDRFRSLLFRMDDWAPTDGPLSVRIGFLRQGIVWVSGVGIRYESSPRIFGYPQYGRYAGTFGLQAGSSSEAASGERRSPVGATAPDDDQEELDDEAYAALREVEAPEAGPTAT